MRILILTYEFPPNVAVGAFRPYSWFKYLGNEEDEITVITRKWNGTITKSEDYALKDDGEILVDKVGRNKIYYVPYKNQTLRDQLLSKKSLFSRILRKLTTFIQLFSTWIFKAGDEKVFLYNEAKKLLKSEKFDIIIATGEPFILFKYAYKLSLKFKIPYILDYRDAWYSGERHKYNTSIIAKFIRFYQKQFEKTYINNALFFTTVSDLLLNDILADFPKSNGILVKNGVDLDEIEHVIPFNENSDKFKICYAGTIYNGHNVPIFINSIKSLIDLHGDKIQVYFIGIKLRPSKHMEMILNFQNSYPDNIHILNSLPQNDVFRWIKSSQVLLKFSMRTTSKDAQSVKMYEYLAFKKPILHILSESAGENDLLKNKNVQFFAKSQDEVNTILENLFNQWQNKLNINPDVTKEDLEVFSRSAIAKMFRGEIEAKLNQMNAN